PTEDRWLAREELAGFTEAIADPSGPDRGACCDDHGLAATRLAVERHLPRDAEDPARIRPDAALVVILMSDEHPLELEEAGIFGNAGNRRPASPEKRARITEVTAPTRDFLVREEATFHFV